MSYSLKKHSQWKIGVAFSALLPLFGILSQSENETEPCYTEFFNSLARFFLISNNCMVLKFKARFFILLIHLRNGI
jgi:hypothetical protein